MQTSAAPGALDRDGPSRRRRIWGRREALPASEDPAVDEATIPAVGDATVERIDLGLREATSAMSDLRDEVDKVKRYLTSVVGYLSQRDRAMMGWVQASAKHTAASFRSQADRMGASLGTRLSADVSTRLGPAIEQVQGHADVLAALEEEMESIRETAEAATERLSVILHERLADLADQMRIESEDMRSRLIERAGQAGRETTRDIDERLGRLAELVQAALGWTVDEMGNRVHGEILQAVEAGLADFLASTDRRFTDIGVALQDRMDASLQPARRGLEEAIRELERSLGETVIRAVDERVLSLAQMVRSDNTALAARLGVIEEQAAAKEATRSVKELAAALPQEISDAMDERLAVLGELFRREQRNTADMVSKAAGILAGRLDRAAAQIGDRFDREVEDVVDQIGSTMQGLATGLHRANRARDAI